MMDRLQITAVLLILGAVLTGIGFGAFPTRIYTARDVQEKLDLLASQPRRWVLCQWLVFLGGVLSVAGSIFLTTLFLERQVALLAQLSAVLFVVGHVFWLWHVSLRITQPQQFARGESPGWLFNTYSILVLLGLAGFGISFWLLGMHPVLGAGLTIVSLLVLVIFLIVKDMLPFVYYAMTLAIGLTLLF